ncbi:HD-GYP domain-containing protein [Saccharophagus degradans]|nr:DUF3391 domain-containing protein [Saccharophagus degradans]
MAQTNTLLSIPISQLRAGMFVVKLDIPWIDSPFLRHSRLIKGEEDIDKLKGANVKTLVIDLSKGCGPQEQPTDKKNLQAKQPIETESPSSRPIQAEQAQPPSLKEELSEAKLLRNRIREVMSNIMDCLERELPIKTVELTPIIDDTLASLERNNQALMNLAHLSRKTQKLADHAFSTFCLCLNLATYLKLGKDEQHTLGLAALMHEAGWVQLPQQLLGKRTAYSATELKLIHTHIANGRKVLKNADLPELVLRLIDEHHELTDGSGYPNGLNTQQLHTLSLLLSAVDHYDEMVHQLTDKPGMLPTNALRKLYVEADAGKYDKQTVTALIASLGIYPVTSAVLLNTGEKAIVLEVFSDAHLQPVLEIHYDSNGKPLPNAIKINLRDQRSDAPNRAIVNVLDPSSAIDDPARRLQPEDI